MKNIEALPLEPAEPAEDMPVDVSTSDAELDALVHDCDELHYAAAATQQLNVASSALNLKLKVLNAKAERAAQRAKNESEIFNADPEDCSTWSPELAAWIVRYQDSILDRMRNMEEEKA